ncbi:MAG: hypothetical protein HUU29_09895 [Planctomycetaceae bacterium]|nr:hypothetical protein [Planctomycetaceae bacterium]
MSFHFVDPETYAKYKDEVLRLSDSFQISIHEHLKPGQRGRPLSDAEIAEKLKLDVRVVREIRVVAERDYYPVDEWEKALEFKRNACLEYSKRGMSYATGKYVKKKQDGA